MEFDLMIGATSWAKAAGLARDVEANNFSGMLFTETSQTPWMSIAAAAMAAPSLTFTTGIAVAFPRSPMVSAALAWELAENTQGRFRLGLGSQVQAHIERRYGVEFDKPGPRMRDYVAAVKACLAAFRGDAKLNHDEAIAFNLALGPAGEMLRLAGDRAAGLLPTRRRDQGLPPATGQSYRLPAGSFFAVRDGRISRVTTYYNLTEWIMQVSGDV